MNENEVVIDPDDFPTEAAYADWLRRMRPEYVEPEVDPAEAARWRARSSLRCGRRRAGRFVLAVGWTEGRYGEE